MEIRTLWTIIIKGIGLWLLMECVYVFPQFASSLTFTNGNLRWDTTLMILAGSILTLILYILAIRLFLFRTDWLINILKLDKNFPQDKIDINVSYETVLSVIVIILGALIIIESLPQFILELFAYVKKTGQFKNDEYAVHKNDSIWLIFHFLKTIIGYLILTNSGYIVKYINREKICINNQTKNDRPNN